MATQQLRKQRLEEKLGLQHGEIIKNGFDQETLDIVWDLYHNKYESLRDHPLIYEDVDSWPDWVFFLVVHNVHAAIWAIEEKHLSTIDVVGQDFLTPYDVNACLKPDSIVHRFHVVLRKDQQYYVQADNLSFLGKEPVFDVCIYVGTLTLSLRAVKATMALIARQNYLLLQSDCLGYCKDFVLMYFDMIEEQMSREQVKILDSLTVMTNALSAASERSGRQNASSGWSLRSFLTSSLVQGYIGTLLGGLTLYLLHKMVTSDVNKH